MTEEEQYEHVNISEIIDDTDQYLEAENHSAEETEANFVNIQPDTTPETKPAPQTREKPEVIRSTRLPMARIKNMMKLDPDVSVVSGDAVFLVTKATELFLETIAKEAYAYTASNKRKVINKKDFDVVVNKVDCLCFLEGAMDF